MTQYWRIFNITKGRYIDPSQFEDDARLDKWKNTIPALMLLLADKYKGDKVILSGDYDKNVKMNDWINEFLTGEKNTILHSHYNDNLYYLVNIIEMVTLKYDVNKYQENMIELLSADDENKIIKFYDHNLRKTMNFVTSIQDYQCVFYNNTKKEYYLFDIPATTSVIADKNLEIIKSLLISSLEKDDDETLVSHGRWCGDNVGFIFNYNKDKHREIDDYFCINDAL